METPEEQKESNVPNPEWHFRLSILKSLLRIFAGMALVKGSIQACGVLLVIAELVGVAEEIV